MRRASKYFTETERDSIAAAVRDAETKTSGEIVPVLATASGRYDRAEDLFGLAFAIAVLVVCWILFQEVRPVEGDWASGQRLALGLREMEAEVERSAAEAFQRFRLRGTAASTGVLIYVSLFEHTVQVIGDDAIASKLSQDDWREVRDMVIEGIRSRRPADGFRQAISRCGELLARHFPVEPGDVNELTNELRIVD